HAAGRRALLSLELETATDDGGGDRVQIALGRRVDEDEVLAAGLADEARVLLVVLDVLADAAPERLEGAGGAGEVDAAQVGAGQCGVADGWTISWKEVDDAIRDSGLTEDLHDVPAAACGGRRRLEEDHVAKKRGGGRQVERDGGEVERRHRQHEPVEGTV